MERNQQIRIDDNVYSLTGGVNTKAKVSPDKERLLVWWYDNMLGPVGVFGIFTTFVAINKDVFYKFAEYIKNNSATEKPAILLLLAISVFAGLRLYQSLYLARKYYYSVKAVFLDTITFIAAGCFMSGYAIMHFFDNIEYLFAIYSAFFILGTANFVRVFMGLDDPKKNLDYLIGRRVQLINIVTLSIISVICVSITIILFHKINNIIAIYLCLAICALFILNMIHSGQLSATPAILLQNKIHDHDEIERYLRHFLGKVLTEKDINEIVNIAETHIKTTHKYLTIDRIKKNDTDHLSKSIAKEFGYSYEYIFGTNDKQKIERVIRSLLKSAFGFGTLGYMHFYSINDSNNNPVGWMHVETSNKYWIYTLLENLCLPFVIIKQFGFSESFKINERKNELKLTQPTVKKKEFRLSYFVIYEQYRNKKYGMSAVNLLLNALFHSRTNNIEANLLTLAIRESNTFSLRLFCKNKCKEYQVNDLGRDPLESVINPDNGNMIGKLRFFKYPEDDN